MTTPAKQLNPLKNMGNLRLFLCPFAYPSQKFKIEQVLGRQEIYRLRDILRGGGMESKKRWGRSPGGKLALTNIHIHFTYIHITSSFFSVCLVFPSPHI